MPPLLGYDSHNNRLEVIKLVRASIHPSETETHHCQKKSESPHVEFASKSIGGVWSNELDTDTTDEVDCRPKRDVVRIEGGLSGLLVGHGRELVDEPLISNNAAND